MVRSANFDLDEVTVYSGDHVTVQRGSQNGPSFRQDTVGGSPTFPHYRNCRPAARQGYLIPAHLGVTADHDHCGDYGDFEPV